MLVMVQGEIAINAVIAMVRINIITVLREENSVVAVGGEVTKRELVVGSIEDTTALEVVVVVVETPDIVNPRTARVRVMDRVAVSVIVGDITLKLKSPLQTVLNVVRVLESKGIRATVNERSRVAPTIRVATDVVVTDIKEVDSNRIADNAKVRIIDRATIELNVVAKIDVEDKTENMVVA